MTGKSIAGVVVSFLVLTVLFFVIERMLPGARRQKLLRKGFWTDLLYWFFTPLVTKGLAKLVVLLPALLLVVLLGVSAEELRNHQYHGFGPLSQQPAWLQALEVFVMGDFIGYWTHRLFHGGRWWPFHAVHHSSEEVDWLSSVRVHPVNDLVTKVAQVLPLALLGYRPDVLAAYGPVLTLYAIFLHANVDWTYGPLRAVIASPVFHRWHHTKEAEAMNKNFAGFFPFWDIVFGTYYMRAGKVPTVFGIDEPMPEGLGGQLIYPFKAAPEAAAAPVSPTGSSSTAS